jgi:hypothetical protein
MAKGKDGIETAKNAKVAKRVSCHPTPSEPWCLGALVVMFHIPVRHFCLLRSAF